jgi:hypothetical protein
MALMYPWATKEYLLWEMTIGQIVMYHNKGMELKYGAPKKNGPSLTEKSASELRKMRDEMKAQLEEEESVKRKESYRTKYGAI